MISKWMGAAFAAIVMVSAPAAHAASAKAPMVIAPVNPGPPTYAPAAVPLGKYACFADGQDLFTDLVIQGPRSYADSSGAAGAYTYVKKAGALTFTSGPFAGSYARMFNARTIGMSDRGSSKLYIQCRLGK